MAGGGGGSGGGGGGSSVSTPKAATLVVDQTPGQGDFTTIAAALAGLSADGGYILVREGTYALAAGLASPDKPILIRGCGRGSTVIDLGSNAIVSFTLGGASAFDFAIKDLTIRGDGTTVGQGAVLNNSSSRVLLENVEIDGMDTALEDTASCSWEIVNSSVNGVTGLKLSDFNNVRMSESDLIGSTDALTGPAQAFIVDSQISSGSVGAGLISVAAGSITGSYLSGQITLDSALSPVFKGITLTDCFISSGKVLMVDDSHGMSNCRIQISAGTTGVSVTGSGCTVDGCRFTGPGGAKFVVESGGADSNTYSDNVGFAGSAIIGPDSVVQEPNEQQLGLAFFRKQGLLPDEIFLEGLYDFPTPDFQNLAGGTLTPSMASLKFVGAAVGASNFGWDLLASKSKILMIFHSQRSRAGDTGIFFTDTLPAAAEIPDGSYIVDTAIGLYVLLKRAAGSFVELSRNSVIDNGTPTLDSGFAFYYDSVTNRLIAFIRTSPECWFPVIDTTDASFATMRYVGIRFNGSTTWYNNCPITIRTTA
jgi:hypothetical protein